MKFAHLADCHLGAFRDHTLRELSLKAFEKAIDICIFRNVDFIIVAGDLFHIHLPDLSVINRAVLKLRELKNAGIPLYIIYGSHDYSPTQHSMIDILQSAGLFTKVNVYENSNEKLKLKVFQDEKTRAKIVGMSARKLGLEKNYFLILDRESLEKEMGFKIFVFHSAVTDYLPVDLQKVNSIPVSFFPEKFDYYAGGHIHITSKNYKDGYGWIVSPGALFGSNYKDLEKSVESPNGFFITEFNGKVENIEFVPVKICDIKTHNLSLDGKNPSESEQMLTDFISNNDFSDKVNLIKINGMLATGNVSDLNLTKFKEKISNSSLVAYFNTHKLQSADIEKITVKSEDREVIEKQIFSKNLSEIKLEDPNLNTNLAENLLKELRHDVIIGQTKTDYEYNITTTALEVLGLHEN